MSVDDPAALLTAVEQRTEESPALYDAISRVAPAMRTFEFHSVEEFKEKVVAILLEWPPRLTGRTFHVRLHRRGDKRELSTQDVERSSTMRSLMQRWRRPCRARYRSPIRMR
jgi:hypothetical protein